MIARMKYCLVAFSIVAALSGARVVGAQSGKAPDPAKVAVIEEIFDVTHPEQMIDQSLEQARTIMVSESEKTLADQVPAGVDKAKYEAAVRDLDQRVVDEIKLELDWAKVKPGMVAIYEDTFTLPELEGTLAFYKSPAGQAMIAKLPQVMSKTMALTQESIKDLAPRIQQITADAAAKMKQAETPGAPK